MYKSIAKHSTIVQQNSDIKFKQTEMYDKIKLEKLSNQKMIP